MYSPFFPFFNLVPSFLLVRTYRFETFDYRDGEKTREFERPRVFRYVATG